MKDPVSQLRTATRRAKSDVANKLISMFLHELSRKICHDWDVRVDCVEYGHLVRTHFGNECPYCSIDLRETTSIIEHLDGMNRTRVGLHIPGNVLVACRTCNNEKRRDDSRPVLTLAKTGWESFLSHDGVRCAAPCATCNYWKTIWPDNSVRTKKLADNMKRIRIFRDKFPLFAVTTARLEKVLPEALAKLYSDCQMFAQDEIVSLLEHF